MTHEQEDLYRKYIFTSTKDAYDPIETRMELAVIDNDGGMTLTQVIGMFEKFLRATGFHFDGSLKIVEPEPVVPVKTPKKKPKKKVQTT